MKVFILGLAAASVVAVQPDNYRGKNVEYGNNNKYSNKYDNGYDSGYKKNRGGYNHEESDDGYGYQPQKRSGYGEDKYQPTSEPTSSYDTANDETNFNSFYDNLKVCKAEYTLESCIINSASRQDCFSEQRIKQCTTQFITSFCDDLSTTTTGKYDNGYVKCDSSTCTDAALADSLLVYNRLLRDVNTALDVTPQFDQWSFTTIKLALASTRNHADCVIKSFFHYLGGCAKSSVLPKRDLKCLDKALSSTKCEWAKDAADGWNLPQFLQRYGDLAFNGLVTKMKSRFGTSSDAHISKAIEDLLSDVKDKETQFVQVVNSNYDYVKELTSVDVCSPAIPNMALDVDAGTDAELVRFHFPAENPNELCKAKYGETAYEDDEENTKAVNLYKKCAAFYKETKDKYQPDTGHEWKCVPGKSTPVRVNEDGDVECMSTNGKDCLWEGDDCNAKLETKDIKPLTCGSNHYEVWGGVGYDDPNHWCYQVREILGNQGDKCFTYSGYSIKFLETGETQDLSLTTLPNDYEGKYGCRRAAWYEPQSCNSHLTQWQMTVGCCQSYASVLEAQQEKWERKYGKKGKRQHGYNKYNHEDTRYLLEEADQYSEPVSEPPSKPTKVPDSFNPFHTAYEKTVVSKADTENSQGDTILEGSIFAYNENNVLSTDDLPNIDKALYAYMEFWWVKCSKLHFGKGSNAQWCSNVLKYWVDFNAAHPNSLPHSVYLTPTGGCNLRDGDIIALESDIGRYVSRCNGCARSRYPDSATVHVQEVQGAPYAQWTVVNYKDGKIGLKSDTGLFLSRCNNCARRADVPNQVFVHVDKLEGNEWAQWTCKNVGNGKIALESDIHTFLSRQFDEVNWSAKDDVAIAEETTYIDVPSAQFVAKRIFDPATLIDASYFMRKDYSYSHETFEGTPDAHVYGEKYAQLRPCYMGASPSYTDVCETARVEWDLNTVVPIVNAKCFPQACVLAQLAQCMDIPAPATPTGYDYVAQPAPGYNGYRPSSYQRPSTYNSYTRSMLGMETSTTSFLALGGFIAGVVVVAVAQVVMQKRGKKQDIAYRMI